MRDMSTPTPEQNNAVWEELPRYIEQPFQAFHAGEEALFQAELTHEQFAALWKRLSAGKVDGRAIIGFIYENTVSGARYDSDDEQDPGFTGEWEYGQLLDTIADMRAGREDFVNDFKITISYLMNESTVVAFGVLQRELERPDGMDEYFSTYWMGLMKSEEYVRREGWKDWEIDDELASADTILEKKGEDGMVELWHLEVGEVVRFICSDGNTTEMFDATIVSAGQEPTVVLTQTNADGTMIALDQPIVLRGGGRWTNWRNNPMVRGADSKLAISYGMLKIGDLPVIADLTQRGEFATLSEVIAIAVQSRNGEPPLAP
jgi:hypothetical protein